MTVNKKGKLSRSERKIARQSEIIKKNKKKEEIFKTSEIEKRTEIRKKTIKIILFSWFIGLVIIVIGGYHEKMREATLIKTINTEPATTIGYVDSIHYFGRGPSCYMVYHYYVDGKRYDNDERNSINMQFWWVIPYDAQEAQRGDSILIKYHKKAPDIHIIMRIIQ